MLEPSIEMLGECGLATIACASAGERVYTWKGL